MNENLPNAKSSHSPTEREKIQRLIAQFGLCGLANDTKWNEFIAVMRERIVWRPSYRFKCVDGPPMGWDTEWFYHLPFPILSVEWFDVGFIEETRTHRLPPQLQVVDHSGWIEATLREIGLDYQKGPTMIRIFGYSPRNLNGFEE